MNLRLDTKTLKLCPKLVDHYTLTLKTAAHLCVRLLLLVIAVDTHQKQRTLRSDSVAHEIHAQSLLEDGTKNDAAEFFF